MWCDHWLLGVHSLRDFALVELDEEALNHKVVDFATGNDDWD